MKSVHADVTTALGSGSTEEVSWFIDIIPRGPEGGATPTGSTFRFYTSAIPNTGPLNPLGHLYGNHLNSAIKWKKTSKQEWDKISVSVNICNSGATDTTIQDLLIEFGDGTLDQSKVVFGFYTNAKLVFLEECRVFKINITDKSLNITITNELHEFRGMFPNTRHEAQSWVRVEDTEDNLIPGNLWEQSSSVAGSSNGRFRKGLKEAGTRDGFDGWWGPVKDDEDTTYAYPWAYGQNLVTRLNKSSEHAPQVLSEGEIGDIIQVLMPDGSIGNFTTFPITPSTYDPTDRDPLQPLNLHTRPARAPQYSMYTGGPQDGHVVFDGKKHYSYTEVGGVPTAGTFASSHNGFTNPIWVMVDILQNGLGLLQSQIDWASAVEIATELEAAEYDLRFILSEPEEIKDIFDKLAKNGSFFWRWGANSSGDGKMFFDRRRASTDAVFKAKNPPNDGVGWMLDFTDADSQISTFKSSDQSIETTPNKFNVKYLVQELDAGRYTHSVREHQMTIQDRVYIKENTADLEIDWLFDPDGFKDIAGTATLPLLETLKEIRMKRVQSRFKVKTLNMNAILLDGADPVRISHSLNSLDLVVQECEVESVQFDGKNAAALVLKPREDDWFSTDSNASINTDVNWQDTGAQEGNIPSYRFAPYALDSPATDTIYLNMFDGADDDKRALARGNALWMRDDKTVTSVETDWQAVLTGNPPSGPTRWHYMGIIQSTTYLASPPRIEVVLNAVSERDITSLNAGIQCQPHATYHSDVETLGAGANVTTWTLKSNLHFPEEWDFATGSEGGQSSNFGGEGLLVGQEYLDNAIEWRNGPGLMSTEVSLGVLTDPASIKGGFRGVARFFLKTRNGVVGTEYVYIFSNIYAQTQSVQDEDAIPDQTGNAGKILETSGSVMSWEERDVADQTGNSGKQLGTNGTTTVWETKDVASQSGQSGKVLGTNGSVTAWEDSSSLPSQGGQSGKLLSTNGSSAFWDFPNFNDIIEVNIGVVNDGDSLLWDDFTSKWLAGTPLSLLNVEIHTTWPTTAGRTIGETFILRNTTPDPDDYYMVTYVAGTHTWVYHKLDRGAPF